jgi:PKD repeat protein
MQASPAQQTPPNAPPSNTAPAGYVPTAKQQANNYARAGGSDILLVQTALPWASDANTQVLSRLGYAYDIVDMNTIAQVDLFRYPVILIVNDQVQAFYDQYASQVTAFETYVAGGGTLVFFASSDGWAAGTLRANLPGGVQITTPWYEYNNYIVDSSHPIVSGELSDGNALVDADLYSDYCSHGYFSQLPPDTNIILSESRGYPTLIEYALGQGRVIASTLTWEHNWAYRNAFGQKALDDVFLHAFASSGVVDGIITAYPNSVPADGATTMNITLAGATPGHRVRLVSDRGSVDTFANATGTVNGLGRYMTTLRSATSGVAQLTAIDLNLGQTFPASTNVIFSSNGEPPEQEDIVITSVEAEHPLDARYLEGVPVSNQVDVTVDWKGSTPGRVDFILNDSSFSTMGDYGKVSHIFDMGKDLRWGVNTLRITAHSSLGQASNTESFTLWLTPMPVWMIGIQKMGVASLPLLASGDFNGQLAYEMGFHLPPYKFEIEAPGFGAPDGPTKLEFDFKGKFAIPLYCAGSYKANLSTGSKGFEFLGTEIEGRLSGELEAKPIGLCVWDVPEGDVKFEVEASKTIYRKPVLVMVAYFNAAVGIVIEQTIVFLQVEELVSKVLGEFYVDGDVHFMLGSDVHFIQTSPYFQFRDLTVGGGLGIEGGYRYNLPILELKVYAGADGDIEFVRPGQVPLLPPLHGYTFDKLTLKGEVGAIIRSGWFERSTTGEISWEYPQTLVEAGALQQKFITSEWSLIPHANAANANIFSNTSKEITSFSRRTEVIAIDRSIATQNTITTVLISNVYTYTEPTLALNPTNNHALLLWTHDDVQKPVGQAHEIQFSRWDGAAWSAPANVTNDNYLDSAPQVAWTTNGQGIALWQRLNDLLPATATLDVTTTRKIEIATATYNPATGQWSPSTLLTTNEALDIAPILARHENGRLLAAWRQNQDGFVGGDASHPDRIMTAFYDNQWGSAQVAVNSIPGLVDLAVGMGTNQALLAYTQYLAAPNTLTPTLQLFTSTWNGSTWSTPIQHTNDALGNRSPQVLYTPTNEPILVWLAGTQLQMHNLASGLRTTMIVPPAIGAIDEFHLLRNGDGTLAAIFTAQSTQRDLYASFYDATHEQWGRPKALTSNRANELYPAPAFDANNRLLLAYASTAVTSEPRSVTTAAGEVINYTVPVEGQTDLVTLAHTIAADITIADTSFTLSTDQPARGETIQLAAVITNSGDLTLDDVTVAFYDGDPAAGGLLIAQQNTGAPIAAGMTSTFTAPYMAPAVGGIRELYALIDPNNQIAEINESDNAAHRAAFGPNLAFNDFRINHWGGNAVDLVSHIANLGTTTSPTTTIAYALHTAQAPVLLTDVVPAIAAGELITVATPWNYPALPTGNYSLVAVANPTTAAAFDELDTTNNVITTTLQSGPDFMVNPYALEIITGATTAYTITIANIGTQTADPSTIELFRRGDLTANYLLTSQTTSPLAPGQTTVVSGSVADQLGCGLYLIVNREQNVPEVTQSNNLVYAPTPGGRCASFYTSATTAIAPASIAFTDTSAGDNTNWLWEFGDGTTSTDRHPVHHYNTRGTYTVRLTVTGPSGSDSYSQTDAVRIYQAVQAAFDASPVTGKTPLQVTFTNRSTGDIQNWQWDFGDGNSSVAENPTHEYRAAGQYTVSLTVSGLGGSNTAVRTALITVAPTPAAVSMAATPTAIPADGAAIALINVTVQDADGNPISGEVVRFSTTLGTIQNEVATNGQGLATTTLKAATTIGIATVTATAGAVTQQTQVRFTAGPPATIVQSNRLVVVADGISTLPIAVTVLDAKGHRIAGQRVTFTTTSGAITAAAMTNDQGVANAEFTAPATPGIATITATAGSTSQTFTITLERAQSKLFLPLIQQNR